MFGSVVVAANTHADPEAVAVHRLSIKARLVGSIENRIIVGLDGNTATLARALTSVLLKSTRLSRPAKLNTGAAILDPATFRGVPKRITWLSSFAAVDATRVLLSIDLLIDTERTTLE
ncbi:hypothetical protein [Cryobacterium zhongshanensis]|uniref:Uncharacterized protein n=1 Tax=Cryobacterium zhongshanensis TaxID=2928153 RepID=A0AA41QS51_9MICO|nr:hypothetical protein [Cryobacterium zhongshanensis]MCI4656459.1 hypothetical protein [Cryobacterium zhongshanensis]